MEQEPVYPYPDREHLVTPRTAAERLHEELRVSGEGQMLRDNIIKGLGAMYERAPLVQSLYVYCETMAWFDSDEESPEAARIAKLQMIYSGALMATHVSTGTLPEQRKQQLLRVRLDGVAEVLAGDTMKRMQIATNVDKLRDTLPGRLLRDYTYEERQALDRFAYAMLSDYSPEMSLLFGEDVQLGYVLGAQTITMMKRHFHG